MEKMSYNSKFKTSGFYLLNFLAMIVLSALYFTGFIKGYSMSLIIILMMYISLSISWSMLWYVGEFSFCQIAFFGVGQYTVALTAYYGLFLPTPINILAGGGVAALLALMASYPLLRIRGWYFAIGTWAFAELIRTLIQNNIQVTRGPYGVFVPHITHPAPYNPDIEYIAAVVIGFGAAMIYYKIIHSRLGLAMSSIRDNFDAAKMIGINTTFYRALIFSMSAFLAGAVGGYFVMYKQYTDPLSAFEMAWIFKTIVIAVIGGATTVAGPMIGAVIVLVLEELGKTFFIRGSLLLLAVILIGAFIFMPGGIMGVITKEIPLKNPYKRYRRMFKLRHT